MSDNRLMDYYLAEVNIENSDDVPQKIKDLLLQEAHSITSSLVNEDELTCQLTVLPKGETMHVARYTLEGMYSISQNSLQEIRFDEAGYEVLDVTDPVYAPRAIDSVEIRIYKAQHYHGSIEPVLLKRSQYLHITL